MPDAEHHPSVRTRLCADITLWHPRAGEVRLHTRDISDGGAYCVAREGLPLEPGDLVLEPGDLVKVQVQGLPDGEAPIVAMRVVRVEPEGVALAFLEADA